MTDGMAGLFRTVSGLLSRGSVDADMSQSLAHAVWDICQDEHTTRFTALCSTTDLISVALLPDMLITLASLLRSSTGEALIDSFVEQIVSNVRASSSVPQVSDVLACHCILGCGHTFTRTAAIGLLSLQALFLLGRLAPSPHGSLRMLDAEPSSDRLADVITSAPEFLALVQRKYDLLELLLHDLSVYQAAASSRISFLRASPRKSCVTAPRFCVSTSIF